MAGIIVVCFSVSLGHSAIKSISINQMEIVFACSNSNLSSILAGKFEFAKEGYTTRAWQIQIFLPKQMINVTLSRRTKP